MKQFTNIHQLVFPHEIQLAVIAQHMPTVQHNYYNLKRKHQYKLTYNPTRSIFDLARSIFDLARYQSQCRAVQTHHNPFLIWHDFWSGSVSVSVSGSTNTPQSKFYKFHFFMFVQHWSIEFCELVQGICDLSRSLVERAIKALWHSPITTLKRLCEYRMDQDQWWISTKSKTTDTNYKLLTLSDFESDCMIKR